jgi:formiminotetrahydrofolate cyclodeaminase
MEKPNADIEWYDDGFTMEEQAELRREYLKTRKITKPVITITEQQKENWKDALISKLKMENAANEEYILELKDEIKEWEKRHKLVTNQFLTEAGKYNALHIKWNELQRKYSVDINEYLQSEEFTEKYTKKIQKLEERVQQLVDLRDELIYKLLHNASV